ncbi:MAG: hypothetical protein GY817_07040 [bacterium]|nr:hypothetical protein [bacterium]
MGMLYRFIMSIFGLILILIGLLFLLRNFFCWYFKINQRLKIEDGIFKELLKLNNNLANNNYLNTTDLRGDDSLEKDEVPQFENEDDRLVNLFNKYKNIAVYNINRDDESIFSYFQAKQYKIIPINYQNIRFADIKTYATIMSVEAHIEILLVKKDTENIANLLNECIARKKIKNDIEYVWFEELIVDKEVLKKFQDVNIKVVNGYDMYKQYAKLMLKTTICS